MTSGEEVEAPEWPVTCSACGTGLGGLPSGEPCPDCGETGRTYLVSVEDSVRAVDSAQVGITYAPDRPWQDQWRAVLAALVEMEAAAVRQVDPPPDWRQLPIRFCELCWHLRDWLRNDPGVPQAVGRSADPFARAHPALKLVGDVANTNKHRNRKPGDRRARISGGTVAEDSASFVIEWTETDGSSGTEDALTTARQAVQDWRDFFAANSLDESSA